MSSRDIREQYKTSHAEYYYLDEILIFQDSVLTAFRNAIEKYQRGGSLDLVRRYMRLAEEFGLTSPGMPSIENIPALMVWVEQRFDQLRQERRDLESQHEVIARAFHELPSKGIFQILIEAALDAILRRRSQSRQELAGGIYYRYRSLHHKMVEACESGLITGIACMHAREF